MKKLLFTILLFVIVSVSFSFAQDGNLKSDSELPSVSLTDSNRLLVQNVKVGDMLQVYSIVGVKVYEVKMDSSGKEITLNIPKGYYVVKVSNIVRKIAIK